MMHRLETTNLAKDVRVYIINNLSYSQYIDKQGNLELNV